MFDIDDALFGRCNLDPNTPIQSAHATGANVLDAGGAVRFPAESIAFAVFRQAVIRDDGSGSLE